ncbi:hypothetical protein [Flexivirga lutea]
MSHDQPGQDDPRGGRDEFDHFFSDRGQQPAQDPDATAWAGPADSDRTHPRDQAPDQTAAPYVRPPQEPQYDEYQPADQRYEPAAYYEEPPQRRGAMWAPVAVIVASLAIVAIVIAIILNNSSGRMAQGAFTPTKTVTQTTGGQPSQTPSSSETSQSSQSSESSSPSSSSSSASSSSDSSSSPSFATSLPGAAGACPGTDSYGTGPKTSCGFAGVVSTIYNAKKDKDGNASFKAKSPETHDNYQVTCQADQYVTCTTETGAVVYILRK